MSPVIALPPFECPVCGCRLPLIAALKAGLRKGGTFLTPLDTGPGRCRCCGANQPGAGASGAGRLLVTAFDVIAVPPSRCIFGWKAILPDRCNKSPEREY